MPLPETPDGLPPGYDTIRHPGHWQLHHIALPNGAPGDFTPYRAPGYAEHGVWPFAEWLEHLGEVLGADHAQAVTRRGLEAGQ
jgi:hypothetical protein